ncbi:MAG: tetratricopeptide repeat protein, partial [Bacteroidota bacterium]
MRKAILAISFLSMGFSILAQQADLDSAKHWTKIANQIIRRSPDSAVQLLQAAADIYLAAGQDAALCRVYNGLAAAHIRRYDYQAAERHAKIGIAHGKKTIGTTHPVYINLLNNIGAIYRQKGALSQALASYKEALEIALGAEKLDRVSLSRLYNNIGIIYRRMGDPREALNYFEAAYYQLSQSPQASPRQLFSLGYASARAYDDLGLFAQARQSMYASRPLIGEASTKSAKNWIKYAHRMANLHLKEEVYDSVSYYLGQADAMHQEFGPYRAQVSLDIRAELALKKADWPTAEQYILQSMALRTKEFAGLIKSPALAQSYQQLGDLYRETEQWQQADTAY